MGDFDRKDAQLDEILGEIRRKREEEEIQPEATERVEASTSATAILEEIRTESKHLESSTASSPTATVDDTTQEVVVKEQKAHTVEKRRSLKDAFSGMEEDVDVIDFMHVNKRMLAPKLGPDEEDLLETEEVEVPEIFQESHTAKKDEPQAEPESHPLFHATSTQQILITEEEVTVSSETVSDDGSVEIDRVARSGILVEEVEEIHRKGVLNVKDNSEDEEFKTFFSNTVVIDSKPLTQRRPKQKRITDFVVGDDGGPVFEEPESNADGGIVEYRSDDETEQVMELLTKRNSTLMVRSFVTGVSAAILLVFNLLLLFEIILPKSVAENVNIVAAVNAVLISIAIAANYRAVFRGFAKLVSFKATQDSVTSAAAIFALIEPIVIIATKSPSVGFSAVVAATALFFSVFGKYISAKRVMRGFKSISADYEKYATTTLDDDAFVKRLTRDFSQEDNSVLIKRKTGFTDDFLAHSKSKDHVNDAISLPVTVVFFLAVVCGIIAYVKTKNLIVALHTISMATILVSPFTATIASSLPIDRMQKVLSRIGCVVPGFSAADGVIDSNCVILEGREIFPRGNVLLHGIKTFDRERIDKAILYAASILIQSCDTMSHMFLNVIQNKTEMLYHVDNIIYEDGLGFSCWIDQTRLLIGSRELLESRDIEVPSRDYENRYTKSSTRDAIYLAVSGKLYAMFVVSYTLNAEVERTLKAFEREGICLLVRTRDFNITAEKISKTYQIPRSIVSVVEEHDMEELSKKTAYVSHTPSLFTHIGSLSSYVGGILSCYKLQGALKLTTTIELAAMIIGALLALLLTVFSSVAINMFTVLLFQLIWLLITFFVAVSRRY